MKDRIRKILREENEFDWIRDRNEISSDQIFKVFRYLGRFGGMTDERREQLSVNLANLIAVPSDETLEEVKMSLFRILDSTEDQAKDYGMQIGWEEGSQVSNEQSYENGFADGSDEGYDEGYTKGYDDGYEKFESEYGTYEDIYEEAYQEGYNEGKEEIYFKAFEEGRRYQADLDEEEFQKLQDPFTRDLEDDEY